MIEFQFQDGFQFNNKFSNFSEYSTTHQRNRHNGKEEYHITNSKQIAKILDNIEKSSVVHFNSSSKLKKKNVVEGFSVGKIISKVVSSPVVSKTTNIIKNSIPTPVKTVLKEGIDNVTGTTSNITKEISGQTNDIANKVESSMDKTKEFFDISDNISDLKNTIKEEINKIKTEISGEIKNIKNGVTGEIKNVKDEFMNDVMTVKNGVTGEIKNVKEEFMNDVMTVKNGVTGEIKNVKEEFMNDVMTMKRGVTDNISSMKSEINNLKNGIVENVNDIKEDITEDFKKVTENIEEIKDNLIDDVKKISKEVAKELLKVSKTIGPILLDVLVNSFFVVFSFVYGLISKFTLKYMCKGLDKDVETCSLKISKIFLLIFTIYFFIITKSNIGKDLCNEIFRKSNNKIKVCKIILIFLISVRVLLEFITMFYYTKKNYLLILSQFKNFLLRQFVSVNTPPKIIEDPNNVNVISK